MHYTLGVAGTGNASKRTKDDTPGPWIDWAETDLADRAIRFIETYCRAPKGYGAGKPMKLAPFQKQWFREILAPGVSAAVKSCPRGQGKSTEFAALAVWATFDRSDSGEPQVPIVATTVSQAIRSVYGVALKMVKAEPALASRAIDYTAMGQVRFEVVSTGGTCFPMANDPDGLQGLDPSLAIVDEIGFQPLETWHSLLLASGKRPRSLVVGIGTPGFDRSKALWHLRKQTLENKDIPGFVFKEHAAPYDCDYRDEKMWHLANPALEAGYQNINSLRTNAGISSEAEFRIFHLGQWVEGTNAWLGMDGGRIWDSVCNPYEFESNAPTWAALDVGVKRDSTALVLMQYREDNGKLHAKARIWLPEKEQPVDPSDIMQAIRELDSQYDLRGIAYDPRLFELPAIMLKDEGLPMIEFPQSIERMSPACGDLYQAIKDSRITHDGDKSFTSQILNAVPRYNDRGFTLAKQKSRGKIDAAVALAMCNALVNQKIRPRSPLVAL